MIRCRDYTTYFFGKGINGLQLNNRNNLLNDFLLEERSDRMIGQGPEKIGTLYPVPTLKQDETDESRWL
jgi:hypothetical protein